MILLAGLIYSAAFLTQCGPAVDPITTQAIIHVENGENTPCRPPLSTLRPL